MSLRLFTSESVTEGHPDKICDQLSDSILDAFLDQDPLSRVACECIATSGKLVIHSPLSGGGFQSTEKHDAPSGIIAVMGEVTSSGVIDIPSLAHKVLADIGYTKPEYEFTAGQCSILTLMHKQSPDIAMGVDIALEARDDQNLNSGELGAGDQGMMFGYACDETDEHMPMPIALAHRVTMRLANARKNGEIPYLRPDGKAQITVEYENDKPCHVSAVVISTQHDPDISHETIKSDMIEKVIRQVIPSNLLSNKTKYYINPTGRFVIGGPAGDSGLTGRKIIVDTYGGYSRHGGGSFSGKDPTKVDRSATYAARHAARNVVAAGLAKRCEVELAYAIGVAKPVSFVTNTFGTGVLEDGLLSQIVAEIFDMRPASIIKNLNLRRPIYRKTASYGHFGRKDIELPWENLDKVEDLLASAKKYI